MYAGKLRIEYEFCISKVFLISSKRTPCDNKEKTTKIFIFIKNQESYSLEMLEHIFKKKSNKLSSFLTFSFKDIFYSFTKVLALKGCTNSF